MVILQRAAIIFTVIVAFSVSIAAILGVKSLLVPQELVFLWDSVLATQDKEKCNIINLKNIRPLGAQGIYKELKKSIIPLKSVSIHYNSARVATIELKAAKPVMRVASSMAKESQESFIVTDLHELIAGKYFNKNAIEHLEKLYIVSYKLLKNLEDALKKEELILKEKLIKNYRIIWYCRQKIVLVSYADANFVIIADCAALKSNKINYAEIIYRSKKANKERMLLDVRFGDYIACAHLRGVDNEAA